MNNITIELSTEDRARLDRLTAVLEKRLAQAEIFLNEREEPAKVEIPTEEPPKPVAETPSPPTEDKPTITLPQIQQKVVQLCATDKGAKKAKVHAIVTAYSPTVSGLGDMPEIWSEIWDKLTALETEE